MILVEAGKAVLPPYPERLQRRARRQLEEMGVEVRTGSLVTAVDDRGVTLASGERIAAPTVLWAAGVQASPLVAMLPVVAGRAGRALVAADLTIPGHPEIFVLGDAALVHGRRSGTDRAHLRRPLHGRSRLRRHLPPDKIPGYSAYLHPVGEGRLLGVGQDAGEEGLVLGTQISLFDVTNPASALKLNQRPRNTLAWQTPAERFERPVAPNP